MEEAMYYEEFDDPSLCEWIVAVDQAGYVSVLESPDIDPYFKEAGPSASDMGLVRHVDDLSPGIYRWKCSLVMGDVQVSGDWYFDTVETELLWSPFE